MHDPNDVIGIVPADTIILPKFERKGESPYCEMIDTAMDVEWKSLNDKHMFSEPINIDSLTDDQRRQILRLQWIYAAKQDEQGKLERIKARLVADGSREKGKLPAGCWVRIHYCKVLRNFPS